MRSGTGTKSGEPGVVTFATNSRMDFFGRAVVPRGQGVLGAGVGGEKGQSDNQRGGEQGFKQGVSFHGFPSLDGWLVLGAGSTPGGPAKTARGFSASEIPDCGV